jgi:hypothetical protein
MLFETLRADWTARATHARVSALPEFADGALTFGAETKLAQPGAIDRAAEADRAIALLSVALGRPLGASQSAHARRALAKAREGDALLALTHLALAGVGRLDDPHEDARRLFLADGLMKAGVTPATIVAALAAPSSSANIDRAYNPDQPRVPAGNGIVSGRWTAEDDAAETSASPERRSTRPSGAQVADASSTRGHEVASDATPKPPSDAPLHDDHSADQGGGGARASSDASESGSSWSWSDVGAAIVNFGAATAAFVRDMTPGLFYGRLAAQQLDEGNYTYAAILTAAAILDVGLAIGTDGASAAEVASARKAAQLAINKAAGRQAEIDAAKSLANDGLQVGEQVTLQTASGAKVRTDLLTRHPETGKIDVFEVKSSDTAPLTANQRQTYPEIEEGGATIVGSGKPGFEGGASVPPVRYQVIRPRRGPQ